MMAGDDLQKSLKGECSSAGAGKDSGPALSGRFLAGWAAPGGNHGRNTKVIGKKRKLIKNSVDRGDFVAGEFI
jgi:hypothetical protein